MHSFIFFSDLFKECTGGSLHLLEEISDDLINLINIIGIYLPFIGIIMILLIALCTICANR